MTDTSSPPPQAEQFGRANVFTRMSAFADRHFALRYAFKRLIIVPISLFVLGSVSFVLVLFIPGNPAITILGDFATPESIARVNAELGIDRPLDERYVSYWSRLLHGDLGSSFFTRVPVTSDVGRFLPNTIELIVLSLLLAVLLGFLIGATGAYYSRRLPDRFAAAATTALQSVPDFFLALVGIYVFFFLLGWAPAPIGRLSAGQTTGQPHTFLILGSLFSGDWATLRASLAHAALPVLSLGLVYSAYFARTTRSTLGNALATPQVEFARACGLSELRVLHYAFLSSRTSVITYIAILFGSLLGGASIVETIFNWRGIGQWALDGVLKVDVPIIQGFVIVAGLMTLLLFLLLDLVVLFLDPRVSYE